MAIWTYTENAEKKNIAISLREGGLILRIGTYANLSNTEYNQVIDAGVGVVLKEGIVPPAEPAPSESQKSKATYVLPWSSNTQYYENQLIVSPEGELIRTLRNFESGNKYVF